MPSASDYFWRDEIHLFEERGTVGQESFMLGKGGRSMTTWVSEHPIHQLQASKICLWHDDDAGVRLVAVAAPERRRCKHGQARVLPASCSTWKTSMVH